MRERERERVCVCVWPVAPADPATAPPESMMRTRSGSTQRQRGYKPAEQEQRPGRWGTAATPRHPPPPAQRQPRRGVSVTSRTCGQTCDTNVWSPETATTPMQNRECMVLLARTRCAITYSHHYITTRTLRNFLCLCNSTYTPSFFTHLLSSLCS